MSKTVLVTIGTRPEAIKMAPVIRGLRAHPEEFSTVVCSTGQHQKMLDDILLDFDIKPDINIGALRRGDLANLTSSLISQMKNVLKEVSPDMSIVHGDTSTALSSAIASFYDDIPVAHVEAGLRTYQMRAPFPEEFNRKTISLVSKLNFAPTEESASNLLSEGVDRASILVTGNTVIDSLLWMVDKIHASPGLDLEIMKHLGLKFTGKNPEVKFVLVTAHRRENLDLGIQNICNAIKKLSLIMPSLQIVFPVHLNPHVIKPVKEILSGIENIHLLQPLNYRQFVLLLMKCHFVITDSGGIQEEAPSLGKPVLVLRDFTERPEAVRAGTVKVVGTNPEGIVDAATFLMSDDLIYQKMSRAHNPYGDGKATGRIIDRLRLELRQNS